MFPHTTAFSISSKNEELRGPLSPALGILGNCSAQQAASITREPQHKWDSPVQSISPKSSGKGEDKVPGAALPSCKTKVERDKGELASHHGGFPSVPPLQHTSFSLLFFLAIYIFHSFTHDVNLSLISNSLVCGGEDEFHLFLFHSIRHSSYKIKW